MRGGCSAEDKKILSLNSPRYLPKLQIAAMDFIKDREINLTESDFLHTTAYAEGIIQFIEKAEHGSHYTIGLFGEWGSGKSSIVHTVAKHFEAKKSNSRFLIYDAWKYSNDSFRRMFLLEVQRSLKFKPKKKFINFYSSTSSDLNIERKPDWHFFLLGLGIMVILSVAIITGVKMDKIPDGALPVAFFVSLATLIINWMSRAFVDYKYSIQEPVIVAPEKFEACFDDMVRKAVKGNRSFTSEWVENSGHSRDIEKLIIVIDNIDRCNDEVAIELLNSVKNFLGNKPNVYFLLPVDEKATLAHINKKTNGDSAHEYLRKLFDIIIRIKHFQVYDLFDFTNALNNTNKLNYSPDTIDVISQDFVTTPRQIIQTLNNLAFELNFFRIRHGQEFVTKYEAIICKALILREQWPEYFKLVSMQPSLLDRPLPERFKENESLLYFLKVTSSIHANIDAQIMETVFGIQDRQASVSDEVQKAIKSKNFESLKELFEKSLTFDVLFNYLTELLAKSIKDQSFKISANQQFELLCHLNTWKPFQSSNFRKIYDIIAGEFQRFGPLIDKKLLITFIKDSMQFSQLLNSMILRYLDTTIRLQNSPADEFKNARELMQEYLNNDPNQNSINILQPVFEYAVDVEKSLKIFDFTPVAWRSIIRTKIFDLYFDKVVTFGDTESMVLLRELEYLSSKVKFTHAEIEHIYKRFNIFLKNFGSPDITPVNLAISLLLDIFKHQEKILEQPSIWNETKDFLMKAIESKNESDGEIQPVFNQFGDPDKLKYESLIIEMYNISGGQLNIGKAFRLMLGTSATEPSLCRDLLHSAKVFGNSLDNISDIIWKVHSSSDQYYHLITYLAARDLNIPNELSNTQQSLLREILRNTLNEYGKEIELIYQVGESGERARSFVESLISELPIEELISRPHYLRKIGINYLKDNVPLNQLAKYDNVLQVFLAYGDSTLVSTVIEQMKDLFTDPNQHERILNLIEWIEQLSEEQVNTILTYATGNFASDNLSELEIILFNKSKQFQKLPVSQLNIVRAIYKSGLNGNQLLLTRKIRQGIDNNKVVAIANNTIAGDPHHGRGKTLSVIYHINNILDNAIIEEGASKELPQLLFTTN